MQDYLGAEPTFGLDDSEDFFGYHVPTMIKYEVIYAVFSPSYEMDLMPLKGRILAVMRRF